jgi:MoaA/NifB/PqqE/SkfB family radical SAM enzyme
MRLPVLYERGWFDWESQDVVPFRWMGREADLSVSGSVSPGARCLVVVARNPFADQPGPRLEVSLDGRQLGQAEVPSRFAALLFPFEVDGEAALTLRLDRAYDDPAGGRSLGVMVQRIEVISPEAQEDPVYGGEWYGWETEGTSRFRWMGRRGDLLLPRRKVRSHRFLTIPMFLGFHDIGQTLTLSHQGRAAAVWPVIRGWGYYSFDLAAVRDKERPESGLPPVLELSLNKLLPAEHHAGDARELGVRVGPLEFHDDESWHAEATFFRENAGKNYEEMKAGRTKLTSYPLSLGIDLYGRCNIRPACVYCLWDEMKDLEGDRVEAVVDEAALRGYGPFFWSARTLVNCSFGEPLLHPRLGEILDLCANRRKVVELSSNGQAFTDRTIRALAGKEVHLYISLDAATRETYAKIRNDHWDGIVASLDKLNEARQKAGGWPRIFLVFIPLRVNAGDLEAYFRLAARIDADKIALRPLQFPGKAKPPVERGGYRFDFAREALSREELEELFERAKRFSRQYGVELANQFDFGKPAPGPEEEAAGA